MGPKRRPAWGCPLPCIAVSLVKRVGNADSISVQIVHSARIGKRHAVTAVGKSDKVLMDELKTLSQHALETLREKYEYTSKIFPDSDSLLAMAEVSLALGEVNKARLLVSDFTEKNGDTSRGRVILAKAYLMCLDAAAAEEELKKALSLDHRNTQASDLLIYIYKSAGKTGEAFKVALSPALYLGRREEDIQKPGEPSPGPEKEEKPQAGVFETDTMLNLYVSQELYEDALKIIEVLCELEPDNLVYRSKREEIRVLLGK